MYSHNVTNGLRSVEGREWTSMSVQVGLYDRYEKSAMHSQQQSDSRSKTSNETISYVAPTAVSFIFRQQ